MPLHPRTAYMNVESRYQLLVACLVLLFSSLHTESRYLYIMQSCPEEIRKSSRCVTLVITLIGALMCIPL